MSKGDEASCARPHKIDDVAQYGTPPVSGAISMSSGTTGCAVACATRGAGPAVCTRNRSAKNMGTVLRCRVLFWVACPFPRAKTSCSTRMAVSQNKAITCNASRSAFSSSSSSSSVALVIIVRVLGGEDGWNEDVGCGAVGILRCVVLSLERVVRPNPTQPLPFRV